MFHPLKFAASDTFRTRIAKLPWSFADVDELRTRASAMITRPELPATREVALLRAAMDIGRISARRAAAELEITLDDLSDLFVAYGHAPIEL